MLFWNADDISLQWIPGQHGDAGEYLAGAVELTADDDGRAAIADSQREIVFPQRDPGENAYLPGSDAARVAWSDPRAASTGSPGSSSAATAAPPSTSTTACCRASTSAPR
ncbi:hypothetical protein [Nannocystis pusilla]|uniref:hypothetical protein n=1 Tax=Nannocystis pusilla TaxID=889268 RepID=UPI003B7BD6CD